MASARWVSFCIIFYSTLLWSTGAAAGVVCEESFPRLRTYDVIVPGARALLLLDGKRLRECFPGHTLEWLNPWEGAQLVHQPAEGEGLELWLIRWDAPPDLQPQPLALQVAISWKGQREVQTVPVSVRRCEDFDFELAPSPQVLTQGELGGDHVLLQLPVNFPQLACRDRLSLKVVEAPPGFSAELFGSWEWRPPHPGSYIVTYEVALGARVKRVSFPVTVEPVPKPVEPTLSERYKLLQLFGLRSGLLLGGSSAWMGPGLELLFEGDHSPNGFLLDLVRFYGFADALLPLGQDDAGPLALGGLGLQVGVGFVTLGSELGVGSLGEEVFLCWTPSYHLYSIKWQAWVLGVSAGYTFSAGEPPAVAEGWMFRVAFVPLE
jgi:hypothetical protein